MGIKLRGVEISSKSDNYIDEDDLKIKVHYNSITDVNDFRIEQDKNSITMNKEMLDDLYELLSSSGIG